MKAFWKMAAVRMTDELKIQVGLSTQNVAGLSGLGG